MANRVGEQLGNYRLVRLLGEGGFAEVYLGEHVYLRRQAAIKVLHTQLTGKEKDKFQAEARTVAHLKHPNIVQVLEFGIDGDVPFLIMSYAPNGNLRQRHSHSKQLPLPTVLHYLKQVTGALQYIHDQKLIHRDIKPHNMLLGADNEVLLSDFGLALLALSSRHESLQGLAGTITYMAPEQLQGKPRLASDQYSLGVVIYEWLSGELPFQGSFTEIASQHVLMPPPPLHEKVPTIPPAVEEVVMVALSKDPQKRFASIQAFARAFEQSCPPLLPAPALELKSQSPQPSTTIVLTDSTDEVSPSVSDQQNAVEVQPAASIISDSPTKPRSQPLLPVVEDKIADSQDQPVWLHLADFPTNAGRQSPLQIAKDALSRSPEQPLPSWIREAKAPIVQPFDAPGAFFTVHPPNQPARASNPDLIKERQSSPRGVSFPQQRLQQDQDAHIIPASLITSLLRRRSRPSLLTIVSTLIVVVILAITGLGYYAFQAVTVSAVTINFRPKVQVFNEVFTMTATPEAQHADANSMTIPVRGLSSSLSASQSGRTTGQVNCSFGVSNCQPGVSQDDVNGLVAQIQPGLEKQLRQDLQHKLGTAQGMQVTDINVQIVSAVSNPLVGQPGDTVTVTLTEQGSVGYIVNTDAQSVARQALTNKVHQFGVNYLLLSNTVTVGRPVVQSIDTTSQKVTIQIAAGGDGVYQFQSAELQSIKANLVGKTVNEARAFLASQPGIDPKTISIRFTQGSGNTLPSDLQRITVVPVDASNVPPVQLQTVTASPSGNHDGTTPTITPSATSTGNGNGQ